MQHGCGMFAIPVGDFQCLDYRAFLFRIVFGEKIDLLSCRFHFNVQVGCFNERLFCHEYRPSYSVMQFPHISRPMVREKQLFRFRAESLGWSFQFSGKFAGYLQDIRAGKA